MIMDPLNLLKSKSPYQSQMARYHSKPTKESVDIPKASKKQEKITKINFPVKNKKQVIFLGHSCIWLPEHENKTGMYEHLKSANSISTHEPVEKKNELILNVAKAATNSNQLVFKKKDFAQQMYENNKPVLDAKNAVKMNADIPLKSEEKLIKSGNGAIIRMKAHNSAEQNKKGIQRNNQNTGNNLKVNESYVVSQHSNVAKNINESDKEKKTIFLKNNDKELVFVGHSATWMSKAHSKPEITISIPENKKNIFFLGHSCTWLPENSEIPKDFFEKFGVENPKVDVIEVKEKQSDMFAGEKNNLKINEVTKNSKLSGSDASKLKHDLDGNALSAKMNSSKIFNRLNNREKNLKILKHDQAEVKLTKKENKNENEIIRPLKTSNKIIDIESSNGSRVTAEKKSDKNSIAQNEVPAVPDKENNLTFIGHSCNCMSNDSTYKQEPKQPNNLRAPLNNKNLASQKLQNNFHFMGYPAKYADNSWNLLSKATGNENKKENVNRNKNIGGKSIDAKVNMVAKEKVVKPDSRNATSDVKPAGVTEKNNFNKINEKTKQDVDNKSHKLNNLQTSTKNVEQTSVIEKSISKLTSEPPVKRIIQFIGHTCTWINDADKKSENSPKLQPAVKAASMRAIITEKPIVGTNSKIPIKTKEKSIQSEKEVKPILLTSDLNQLNKSENDGKRKTLLNDKILKSPFKNVLYKITESTAILDKHANSIKIKSNIQSTSTKIPLTKNLDSSDLKYNVILDSKSNKLKFITNIEPTSTQNVEGIEKINFKNFEKKPIREEDKLAKIVNTAEYSNNLLSKEQSLPTTFEIALGKLNNVSEKQEKLDARTEVKNNQSNNNSSKSNVNNPEGNFNPGKSGPKEETLNHSLDKNSSQKPSKFESPQQQAVHQPKKDEINKAKEMNSKNKATDLRNPILDADLERNKKVTAENTEKNDYPKVASVPNMQDKNQQKEKVTTNEAVKNDKNSKSESQDSLKDNKSVSANLADKKVDQVNIELNQSRSKNVTEKIVLQNNKEKKIDANLTPKPEPIETKLETISSNTKAAKTLDSTKAKKISESASVSPNPTDKNSKTQLPPVTKEKQADEKCEQPMAGNKTKFESTSKKLNIKTTSDNFVSKGKLNVSAGASTEKLSQPLNENKGFILIDANKTTNKSFVPPDKVLSENSTSVLKKTDMEISNNLNRSISDHVKAEQTIQKPKIDVSDPKIQKTEINDKRNLSSKVFGKVSEKDQVEKSTAKLKNDEKNKEQVSHYKKQVQREQNEMNKIIKKMESFDTKVEFKSATKIINENQTNAKNFEHLNDPKMADNFQKQQTTVSKPESVSNKDIPAVKKENPKVVETKSALPSFKENTNNEVDYKNKDRQSDKIIQQSAYAISSIVREKLNETALNFRILNSPTKPEINSPQKIFDVSKPLDENGINKTKSFSVKVSNMKKVQKREVLKKPIIAKPLNEPNVAKQTFYSNPLQRVYKELDLRLKAAQDSVEENEKNKPVTQKISPESTMKCTLTENQLKELYLARMDYDNLSDKVLPENLALKKIPIDKKTTETSPAVQIDPFKVMTEKEAILTADSLKPSKKLRNVYIPFSFEISRSVKVSTNLENENEPKPTEKKFSNPILNQYKNYFQKSDDKQSVMKEKLSIFHEIINMIKEDVFTHSAVASTATKITHSALASTAIKITPTTQIIENLQIKGKIPEKQHEKLSIKEKKSENNELQLSEESCASQPNVDGKMRPLTIFHEIKNMIKEDLFSLPNQNAMKFENNVKIIATELSKTQIKENPTKSEAKLSIDTNIMQNENIPEKKNAGSKFTKKAEIKNNEPEILKVLQKIDPISKEQSTKIGADSEKLKEDEIKVKKTHFQKIPKSLSNTSKQTEAIINQNENTSALDKKASEVKLNSTEKKDNLKSFESKPGTKTNFNENNISEEKITQENVELQKIEQSINQRPETLMEQIKYLFKVNKAPKTVQQTKNETEELLALLQIKKDTNNPNTKPKIIEEHNLKIESERFLEPLKDDAANALKSNESIIISTAQKKITNFSESPTHKLLDKNAVEYERAKLFNITKAQQEQKISTQSRRGSLDLNKVKEFKITDTPPSPIIGRINRNISSNKDKLDHDQKNPNSENASANILNNLNGNQKIDNNCESLKTDNESLFGILPTNTNELNAIDKNEPVLNKYENYITGNKETIQTESQISTDAPISILNHLTNMNTEQSKIDQNIKLFTETENKLEKPLITENKVESLKLPNNDSQALQEKNIEKNKNPLTSSNIRLHKTVTDNKSVSTSTASSTSTNKKTEKIILNSNDKEKNFNLEKTKTNIENKKTSIVNFTKNTEKLNKNNFDYDLESNTIDLERNHYDSFEVNPFTKNQILVKILCSLKLATIKKD